MAGEEVVQVEDDTVVTVDVSGMALVGDEIVEDKKKGEDEGEEGTTTRTRQAAKLDTSVFEDEGADTTVTQKPNAVEEAAKALTEATKKADSALATAAAERQARLAAEERLQRQNQEIINLRDQTVDQQLTLIDTKIKSITDGMASAEAELAQAQEQGEFAKIAKAQSRMAVLGGQLAVEQSRRDAHEEAKKNKPATTEGRVETHQPTAAFDRYVSGFNPRAQSWLRQHPECAPAEVGGDHTKNASMMAGHYAALAQRVQEGSDDYYRIIEEHTGIRTPATSMASETRKAGLSDEGQVQQRQQTQTTQQQQRKAQPSAPPSRDGSEQGTQPNVRTLRLNADQQEAALFSYPAKPGETDAAHRKRAFGTYANEFVAAQKAGQIGRMTH